jgi:DNA-binding MarR family transcriptional regulator
MGADETTRQISEYSRILSQLLADVIEQNYLTEYDNGVLNKTQFTILKILSISGTYTVSEIADILLISRAAASKNIDKLVNAKYVTRKTTPKDRRSMEISLIAKGSKFVSEYEKFRLEKQSVALSNFTNKEKEDFLNLIRKYVQNCVKQEVNIDLICLQCNIMIEKGCALSKGEERCRFYYRIVK